MKRVYTPEMLLDSQHNRISKYSSLEEELFKALKSFEGKDLINMEENEATKFMQLEDKLKKVRHNLRNAQRQLEKGKAY
jgi:hypothetical protein